MLYFWAAPFLSSISFGNIHRRQASQTRCSQWYQVHSHVQELQESAQGVIGRRRCALHFDNPFIQHLAFPASRVLHIVEANMPDMQVSMHHKPGTTSVQTMLSTTSTTWEC